MDDATRASLRLHLTIGVSMLPRHVRHDLWRNAEPQHERAKAALVEAMLSRMEELFEVRRKDATLDPGSSSTPSPPTSAMTQTA